MKIVIEVEGSLETAIKQNLSVLDVSLERYVKEALAKGVGIDSIIIGAKLAGERMGREEQLMDASWDEVQESTKIVEEWAKDQPPEIQQTIQRIISAAHGEMAAEEANQITGGIQVNKELTEKLSHKTMCLMLADFADSEEAEGYEWGIPKDVLADEIHRFEQWFATK